MPLIIKKRKPAINKRKEGRWGYGVRGDWWSQRKIGLLVTEKEEAGDDEGGGGADGGL